MTSTTAPLAAKTFLSLPALAGRLAALLLVVPALVTTGMADVEEITRANGTVLLNNPAEKTVEVHVGGSHFTTYHYGDQRHIPFLWPVLGEGGVGMTRNFPMAKDQPASEDHPHHCSLYLTYGAVNGHDFWHVGRGQPGVIRTAKLQTGAEGHCAWIRTRNHWVAVKDERVLMEEDRELRFRGIGKSGRLIDITSTFHATAGDVTFGDSKEGMLALRIRPEIDGEHGGVLTNADGVQGEKKVYGKPSPWMDYSGKVAGHGVRGIALMDHPDNFRPAQWHVRNYGLAALNPFGRKSVAKLEDGRYTIEEGDSLTLCYRIYVHSGDHEEADVAAVYRAYSEDKEGPGAD